MEIIFFSVLVVAGALAFITLNAPAYFPQENVPVNATFTRWGRAGYRRRNHQQTLQNIERLERELGLSLEPEKPRLIPPPPKAIARQRERLDEYKTDVVYDIRTDRYIVTTREFLPDGQVIATTDYFDPQQAGDIVDEIRQWDRYGQQRDRYAIVDRTAQGAYQFTDHARPKGLIQPGKIQK